LLRSSSFPTRHRQPPTQKMADLTLQSLPAASTAIVIDRSVTMARHSRSNRCSQQRQILRRSQLKLCSRGKNNYK